MWTHSGRVWTESVLMRRVPEEHCELSYWRRGKTENHKLIKTHCATAVGGPNLGNAFWDRHIDDRGVGDKRRWRTGVQADVKPTVVALFRLPSTLLLCFLSVGHSDPGWTTTSSPSNKAVGIVNSCTYSARTTLDSAFYRCCRP